MLIKKLIGLLVLVSAPAQALDLIHLCHIQPEKVPQSLSQYFGHQPLILEVLQENPLGQPGLYPHFYLRFRRLNTQGSGPRPLPIFISLLEHQFTDNGYVIHYQPDIETHALKPFRLIVAGERAALFWSVGDTLPDSVDLPADEAEAIHCDSKREVHQPVALNGGQHPHWQLYFWLQGFRTQILEPESVDHHYFETFEVHLRVRQAILSRIDCLDNSFRWERTEMVLDHTGQLVGFKLRVSCLQRMGREVFRRLRYSGLYYYLEDQSFIHYSVGRARID